MNKHYKYCYAKFIDLLNTLEKLKDESERYSYFFHMNENNKWMKPKSYDIIDEGDEKFITKIKVKDKYNNQLSKPKIGIANIKIPEKIMTKEYLELTKEKQLNMADYSLINDLTKLVDDAIKNKVDILVLPECAVPILLLDKFIQVSKREQIAMVFGIQHVINDKDVAFNFQITILPFINENGLRDAFIDFRLKKHYSPHEARELKGMGYVLPHDTINGQKLSKLTEHYVYIWRGIWFSSINCYEFTDLCIRSSFRNNVDLLILSEWNKDTDYFSNLVETSVNDIHCYIAQANSSQYGDSRITAPKSRNEKDILKIKGGDSFILISDIIDIKKLRVFQSKHYELQQDCRHKFGFKPTPPSFDPKHERIKNLIK